MCAGCGWWGEGKKRVDTGERRWSGRQGHELAGDGDALTASFIPRRRCECAYGSRVSGTYFADRTTRRVQPHTHDPSPIPPQPHPNAHFKLAPTKASAPWKHAVAETNAAKANTPFILDASSLVCCFCSACVKARGDEKKLTTL